MLAANRAGSQTPTHTTIYVGNYFEVRDHDQPTKYVFDGLTRVASATGSLSANSRVQRIRLYEGWNLISVAVTATNLARQLGQTAMGAIYEWAPLSSQYSPVLPGQTVLSGSVLWVKAETNFIANLIGTYSDPLNRQVPPGAVYVPGSGLEAWTPSFPPGVSGWFFQSETDHWSAQLAGPLAVSYDPPWTLAPGQALLVNAETPIELTVPDPALRIRYYHQDHLGSSGVISDQAGNLVEELAFYPLGHSRNDFKPRQVEEPYQFTQKERDAESGLDYFGKRFYNSTIGRWVSPDPFEERGGSLNLYAYVNENPLTRYDPNGAQVKVTYKESGLKGVYNIEVKAVVVNASSHHFSKQELQQYANDLKKTINKTYQGSTTGKFTDKFHGKKGSVTWHATVTIDVIDDPGALKKDDPRHVFRIVDETKDDNNRSISVAGTAHVGGRVMDIALSNFTQKQPGEVNESTPGNHNYGLAYESPETVGAHELGHDLGLPDINDGNTRNLMSEGRLNDSAEITYEQVHKMLLQYNANQLNRSDEALVKEGKAGIR